MLGLLLGLVQDLRDDAADRPDVTGLVVFSFFETDFWRPVPPRETYWGEGPHFHGGRLFRGLEVPGKPEVAELDGTLVCD